MNGHGQSSDQQPKDVQTKLEMYNELETIDNVGDMNYHERLAYNLEHLAAITCLIRIRMPSQSHSDTNNQSVADVGQNRERPGFFFGSADSYGNCRVWDIDRRASLLDFKFQEEKYSNFEAGVPP